VNSSFVNKWILAGLLTYLSCVCGRAAEYAMVPYKMHGTKANVKVLCRTPTGWQGWKDDPHYWDGIKESNRRLVEGEYRVSVSFWLPDCKYGRQCGLLTLETIGLDSPDQARFETGMQNFLKPLQQHQDRQRDPDPEVSRYAIFDAGALGPLTIWQIRTSFYNDYFLVIIVQRDVVVTVYLYADDVKHIVGKLDSLKELTRSVRFDRN